MDHNKEQFVSVVMTVFNGEQFLREAIESVLKQSHKNFEFVIVDDGSTDSTPAIIREYMAKDFRVKLFSQENKGLPVALNKGLELATSDIIARMDADDVMLPNRLERQINYLLAHPEATVVSCASYHINGKGEKIGKGDLSSGLRTVEQCKELVAKGGLVFCLHPGAIFRKGPVLEIGGYDEKLTVGEDVDLWNRLADFGYYTIVMPERLLLYRIHGNAFTGNAFMKKWDYVSWMFANIKRRRNGEPEMPFEDYKKEKENKPAYIRWNDLRMCYGAIADRNSAVMYGEGKYFAFVFYLIGCVCLRPRLTLLRLKTHLM